MRPIRRRIFPTTRFVPSWTLPALAAAVILAWTAAGALARLATLTLQDGRTITGELSGENDREVTLTIAGIKTSIPRDQIKDVQYTASIEEQYVQKRAQIPDRDVEARYNLAVWLRDNGALDTALTELTQLSAQDPSNVRVSLLKRTVEESLKLREVQATRPAVYHPPGPNGNTPTPANGPGPGLTEAQINALKLELSDPNLKPRMVVPNDVMDELFKRYSDDPRGLIPHERRDRDAIKAGPASRKVELIQALGATDLYAKVQIKDDPPVVNTFRKFQESYVVNYCGTMDCHGGPHGGKFAVFRGESTSEPTIYTNLTVLLLYEDKAGRMVDYRAGSEEEMAQSLLLQYGLPRALARVKHPETPGWHAAIQSTRDPRYNTIMDFIRDNRLRGMTVFPIKYQPPVYGRPTTAPATTRPAGR